MEPITYANGSTLEDPAITYGIVFSNFMSKGVFTFEGGTDRLIELMQDELVQERRRRADQVRRREDSRRARPRDGRDGQWPHDQVPRGRLQRQPASSRSSTWSAKSISTASSSKRPKPCGSTTSSTQVYMALKPGERIDESTRRFAVQLDRAALPHRAAAQPRRHQPHLFVLLSAHAAAGPAALPDRLAAPTPTTTTGRSCRRKSTKRASRTWSKRRSTHLDKLRAEYPRAASTTSKPRRRRRSSTTRSTSPGRASARSSKGWPSAAACPSKFSGLYHAGSVGIIMSGWLGAINYGVIVANDVDALLMKSVG